MYFVALVILPGLLYLTPLDHGIIQHRMALHVVALCVAYFIILKHLNYSDTAKRICYNFAQHSFGIYLVHIIVLCKMIWPLMEVLDLHYALQVPLTTLMTAAISYLIVKLFSFLPYSKYLVGV